MKKTKRIITLGITVVSLVCLVVFPPWDMVKAWILPLPDTIQEQLDQALRHKLDGIIVYIDQPGKPNEYHAAGWKDRENEMPVDPQALFKIASISKLYIAAATAKLITSQSLSLDEKLSNLLPELDDRIENADEITLRMLLQHRSGIPDFIDDPEYPWDKSLTDLNEILGLVVDDPSEFEPDNRYDYSNTNYLLIGNILDRTLGYGHQDYIKNEILDPLGLTHTYGLLSEVDSNDVVSGYDTHFEQDVKMLDFISPGGSMIATAEDVGIFLRALNDGSLFSTDEQTVYSSIYKYEHTGLLPGYQSIAKYHKDIDTIVIQFVSSSGGDFWTISEIVYNRIIKILRKGNTQ